MNCSIVRTNNFTICMEIQKTLNSQNNLEKEEWNWRNQSPWLQTAAAAAAKLQQPSVVSDSVQPHRWQPTRLHRPWDSPGKNTGVGCHFLLQCMKVKSLSRVWLLVTPCTAAYQAPPSMGFSRQKYWSGVPFIVFSDFKICQVSNTLPSSTG